MNEDSVGSGYEYTNDYEIVQINEVGVLSTALLKTNNCVSCLFDQSFFFFVHIILTFRKPSMAQGFI